MVNIDNYIKAADDLKKNRDICLFAILKMDELTDRWSILVSTPKIKDKDKRSEILDLVRTVLAKNLTSDDAQDVARIGMFPLDSHIVEDALTYENGARIVDTKLNGSFVHEGYILISRKPKAAKDSPTAN